MRYTFKARSHIWYMYIYVRDTPIVRRQGGTVSCKLTYPDHFWQPEPILATKSGPGSDQFWQRKVVRLDQFSRDTTKWNIIGVVSRFYDPHWILSPHSLSSLRSRALVHDEAYPRTYNFHQQFLSHVYIKKQNLRPIGHQPPFSLAPEPSWQSELLHS